MTNVRTTLAKGFLVLVLLASSFALAPASQAAVPPYDSSKTCSGGVYWKGGIDYYSPTFGRAVIVMWPRWWARYDAGFVYQGAYNVYPCLPGTWWYTNVVSWRGIEDQAKCHDFAPWPFNFGTGETWDLEGHRGTAGYWTWIRKGCNW